jgi:hypothetical protein
LIFHVTMYDIYDHGYYKVQCTNSLKHKCTRNAEENETLSRSLFRKMIPHCRLQTRSQCCCPRSATPHQPSLTILYTWQNLVRLISVSTIILIKGHNGPYIASTIFSTYHFNIYPILIQIPCTLYYKPYITSIFFLIFI